MLHKTTEMLILNLEFYTIWNYRRQILEFLISDQHSKSSAESLLYGDLKFTMECLLKHPKSYWVWNHRSWCLEKLSQKDWIPELGLVSKMLDLDIRNFHGWDYRRSVVSRVPSQTLDKEWAYSTQKIHQNFSNYSAWHYRSKLLEKAFPDPEKQLEMREKGNRCRGQIHDVALIAFNRARYGGSCILHRTK